MKNEAEETCQGPDELYCDETLESGASDDSDLENMPPLVELPIIAGDYGLIGQFKTMDLSEVTPLRVHLPNRDHKDEPANQPPLKKRRA